MKKLLTIAVLTLSGTSVFAAPQELTGKCTLTIDKAESETAIKLTTNNGRNYSGQGAVLINGKPRTITVGAQINIGSRVTDIALDLNGAEISSTSLGNTVNIGVRGESGPQHEIDCLVTP